MKHIAKEDLQAFTKSIADLRKIISDILDHIEILGDVEMEQDFVDSLKDFTNKVKAKNKQ